jgi:hypothetical protein
LVAAEPGANATDEKTMKKEEEKRKRKTGYSKRGTPESN